MAEDVYLRFQGISAECLDLMHPGKFGEYPKNSANGDPEEVYADGWIPVQSFNFKFGWGVGDTSKGANAIKKMLDQNKNMTAAEKAEAKKHLEQKQTGDASAKKEETLGRENFSFTKRPDVASIPLLGKLKAKGNDRVIPKAVLEMCRPSASDRTKKVAFLRLIFENVEITECRLDVSGDPMPSETVQFKFEKATLQSIWTYNTSGYKAGDADTAGWDFEKKTRCVGQKED